MAGVFKPQHGMHDPAGMLDQYTASLLVPSLDKRFL